MMYRFVLLVPLLIAACATSRENCLSAATKDLQTINFLIAETEANLVRGFAYEANYSPSTSIGVCAGGWNGFRFCTSTAAPARYRPIAIDPVVERGKLSSLQQQHAELSQRATPAVQACEALYPSG